MKIAIVFDNKRRADTTGVFCLRALAGDHEAVHFLPEDLPRIDPRAYDLFLNIDDGFRYRFPRDLRPSIFWAIDTHIRPQWYLEKAADFDLVFCAQKKGAEFLRQNGVMARWCPLACDPQIHRRHPVPKIFDISFVGNFGKRRFKRLYWTPKDRRDVFTERKKLVALLKRKYNLFTGNFYFDEMSLVYSLSRIVFNRSVKEDMNMRVFEALACGSLLLTDKIDGSGQDLLFKSKNHLVEYQSKRDLLEAVSYYLTHAEERERIADAGRERVLAKHTYAKRMDYMLSFLSPHTEKKFDFCGVEVRGDEWVYEQSALAQWCRGLKRGVDVGCGPRKINEGALGIDILKNQQADILSSGDRLPFGDEELDYVVACHNLEHYADSQKVLAEWKRVLKKGGILGAVVPDDRIIDTLSLNAEHKIGFTPETMKREIIRSGGWELEVMQEIVDAWSFGFILRKNG